MEENNKIKKEIINQIKTGKVKLRSKYIFLVEKLGLGSSFVLSLVLSILFFNLILFYLKSADVLVYLSFGKSGLLAFLESFPYLLVLVFILFVVTTGFVISKTDFSYKKSFSLIAIGLVIFVMSAGTIVAYTNISEEIDKKINQNHPLGKMFRPFMGKASMAKGRGIAGRLIESGDNNISVETPHGIETVNIENCDNCNEDLEEGGFVVGVGERENDVFKVNKIRVVEKKDMHMIRNRTNIRHGYWECKKSPSSIPCEGAKDKRKCVKECKDEGLDFNECRGRCSNK